MKKYKQYALEIQDQIKTLFGNKIPTFNRPEDKTALQYDGIIKRAAKEEIDEYSDMSSAGRLKELLHQALIGIQRQTMNCNELSSLFLYFMLLQKKEYSYTIVAFYDNSLNKIHQFGIIGMSEPPASADTAKFENLLPQMLSEQDKIVIVDLWNKENPICSVSEFLKTLPDMLLIQFPAWAKWCMQGLHRGGEHNIGITPQHYSLRVTHFKNVKNLSTAFNSSQKLCDIYNNIGIAIEHLRKSNANGTFISWDYEQKPANSNTLPMLFTRVQQYVTPQNMILFCALALLVYINQHDTHQKCSPNQLKSLFSNIFSRLSPELSDQEVSSVELEMCKK